MHQPWCAIAQRRIRGHYWVQHFGDELSRLSRSQPVGSQGIQPVDHPCRRQSITRLRLMNLFIYTLHGNHFSYLDFEPSLGGAIMYCPVPLWCVVTYDNIFQPGKNKCHPMAPPLQWWPTHNDSTTRERSSAAVADVARATVCHKAEWWRPGNVIGVEVWHAGKLRML